MEVVSLNKTNFAYFKALNSKRNDFNSMNLDFFDYYKDANFINKIITRKSVRLLKIENKFIGYIWEKPIKRGLFRIQSIYLDKNYITKENIIGLFRKKDRDYVLHYKGDKRILSTLNEIGFNFRSRNLILYISLSEKFIDSRPGISYRRVILRKDEELRCEIQNKIFKNKDRIPLTIDDIYYDELQKYYYSEGAVFMQLNNKVIGYGQVIIDECKPYIVNFGIIDEYKGNGYGRNFLYHLLNIILNEGYSFSLIKVDKENFKAVNLYKSTGFKEIEENYILETRKYLEEN